MEVAAVISLVEQVAAVPPGASRESLLSAVGSLRRLRSWVEAREAAVVAQVADVVSFPEKAVADAGGGSLHAASVALERAALLRQLPALAAALSAGRVTGDHVDVLVRRLARIEPSVRSALLDGRVDWCAAALCRSPERFSAYVGDQTRLVERVGGQDRSTEQRQKVALSWRSAADGMHEWRLLLDPLSAAAFDRAVADQVAALFHSAVPAGCPTNSLQRQAFLRAHALLSLMRGEGSRVGRPEFIVVVDARDEGGAAAHSAGSSGTDGGTAGGTAGWGDAGASTPGESGPVVDFGLPVEVPQSVLADLFGRADAHAVVVRNGVVLHAAGNLQLGRSTRLASRAQRRALRGLYATCAVPGCSVRYDHTSIHHVIWWRRGGATDLENLLPLCSRHHHLVHEGGWLLSLAPDRTLTVDLPDGTVMSTGPPGRRAA